MYNIIISIAATAVLFALLTFVAGLPWWLSVVIALVAGAASFYFISRSIMQKVMDITEGAARDIQAQRVDKAIRELQQVSAKYGKWQVYVASQIDSQIGMIYYMRRDFANAFPYLEKGFFKNWVAIGMLGVSYMKRNKKDKMQSTFEKGVQWNSKESLLWSLYAYCLNEIGDPGKAKEVLERGLKKLPGDERITHNLEALKEGKRMKMKSYGDMWLQFHLEKQSTIMRQQAAAMGMRRKIIRK